MAVSLSALRTGRTLSLTNNFLYSFLLEAESIKRLVNISNFASLDNGPEVMRLASAKTGE
jgi:hypothetical protein